MTLDLVKVLPSDIHPEAIRHPEAEEERPVCRWGHPCPQCYRRENRHLKEAAAGDLGLRSERPPPAQQTVNSDAVLAVWHVEESTRTLREYKGTGEHVRGQQPGWESTTIPSSKGYRGSIRSRRDVKMLDKRSEAPTGPGRG